MPRPVLAGLIALAYCVALQAAEPESSATQAVSPSTQVEPSEGIRATQSTATDQPAAAKTPAPQAAKPATSTTSAAAAEQAGDKFKIPPSYKPMLRDGETVYCRSEVESGSRFKKRFCYTLAELKEVERLRAEMQADMSRSRATCSSASACASN